jgi:hypothetical protein
MQHPLLPFCSRREGQVSHLFSYLSVPFLITQDSHGLFQNHPAVMIRLPPSLLTLGPRDLVEFEERRQQRGWKKSPQHVSRFDIGDDVSGPNFCNSRKMRTNSDESSDEYKTFIHSPKARPNDSLTGSDGYEELQYPLSADLASEDQSSVRSNVTSPENASLVSPEVQPFSSPKDVFRYGDFDESQTPPHSLPFAPEEGSTPPNLPLNQVSTFRRTSLTSSRQWLIQF